MSHGRGPSLGPGCVVPAVCGTRPHPTPSRLSATSRGQRLYAPAPPGGVPRRRGRGGPPQFLPSPFAHPASLTPEGSLAPALPGSSLPSVAFAVNLAARLPLVPCGLASRGCRIRFMLRAGRLLPPKGLLTLRFDPGRFPPVPATCYRASWQLPGLDFHQLVRTS